VDASTSAETSTPAPLAIEVRTILLLGLAYGFAFFDRMTVTFVLND